MNVFVFTASNQSAQKHLKDTVEKSVEESTLKEFLSDLDFKMLSAAAGDEGYFCWGATPGTNNERNWNQIEVGDKILSYWNSKYHHISTIIYKVRNVKLATKLWGTLDGNTWEFMYFFKKPYQFDLPRPAEETSTFLQSKYMGFAKIKKEKVDRIINDFGTLENLFNSNQTNIKKQPSAYTSNNNQDEMNILTAIKTKPFILLAGISGTGKSRLVRTLAYKTCSKEELRKDQKKPGNFELIPVRPNWHDSSELMGYVSRIGKNGEKYIITSYLRFIAKAWKHTDVPFFLCLDEMNLAPVEQYFAEYLSIIETRQIKEEKLVTDFIISKESFENQELYIQLLNDLELDETNFKEGISIPSNLIVIGTVNMDETTHSFSRKVLDRAMTFEMNNVDLAAGLDLNTEDWGYPKSNDEYFNSDDVIGKYTSGAEVYSIDFKEKDEIINFLKKINNELEGTPFKIAYRVRDEFLIYCFYASLKPTNDWLTIALDEMTSMKILSRIEGDETKTGDIIEKLLKLLDLTYPKSNNKLNEMKNKLQFGYTSFWS
jgi:energy-coupling factor transporter ATP-binding protein EcfA2